MTETLLTHLASMAIWRRPGRFRRWREMLSARGIGSVEIWQYDSSGFVPIDELAKRLASEIREHQRSVPVNLIGFSMGGLDDSGGALIDPTLPIETRGVFEHAARGERGWRGRCHCRRFSEMRPRSVFLHQLISPDLDIQRLIAVYCPGDVMILPGTKRGVHRDTKLIVHAPCRATCRPVNSPWIRRSVVDFLCGESGRTNEPSKVRRHEAVHDGRTCRDFVPFVDQIGIENMTWFPHFLSPLSAILAAAIAIPSLLVLYFLKLRRREMDVASTFLWKKAIQDLQVNAPFQKLRRNLLLLLQLLLLLLLCSGAFAAGVELHAGGGEDERDSHRSLGVDGGEGREWAYAA